eukprot:m.156546 g.156546  ORF g.156546 m.156546 type:complete len:144 (+) comp38690_c0_seq12:3410-3841(+)
MGGCFAARGENERNRNLTKEAYSIAQASLDPDDPTFAYYLHDYGFSLAKMGKFSDGISLLQRSLILWKQQPQLPEFDRAIAKSAFAYLTYIYSNPTSLFRFKFSWICFGRNRKYFRSFKLLRRMPPTAKAHLSFQPSRSYFDD